MIPVVLALLGCGPRADVYDCPDPADFHTVFTHTEETWDPCALDPSATALCGKRMHRVLVRTDEPDLREPLVVHLPGTRQDTDVNQRLLRIAAFTGYRTIGLGYANDTAVFPACEDEPPGCHGPLREEVVYGTDTSSLVDVAPADAVVSRLLVLLKHLEEVDPDGGWGAYRDGDAIAWEQVIVSGFSQGAGHAALIARDHAVGGVVLFSGPGDSPSTSLEPWNSEPAPWIEEPRATPGCVHFSIRHTLEVATIPKWHNFTTMGMGNPPVDVDTVAFPYDSAEQLTTAELLPGLPSPACDAHSAIGRDGCIRDALVEPYSYMFCAAGAREPGACP